MKQTEENKTPFPYPDDWNFNISSVSFVDRQQGWLSAFIYDGTKDEETCLLRQSTDGGITWQVRDTIQPTIDWKKAEWFSPCRVTFLSDQVGWVYNPGLFTTRDGGKHWKDEGFGYYVHHEGEQQTGEAIVSLKIVGSTAWALRWSRVKGQNSQYQLIFFDPQKGWLPAETQPPTFYGTGYGISGDILPGANGKIWIFNPAGDAQDRHLLMTKDQGKTWEEVSLPNDISTCVNDLTISPDGTLWLFCTPTPLGAPGTPGSIYHLPDGNHTWKKLCHDYAKEGNLCWVASGETYLHTFTSKTTAFAGLRHASLIVTHDGGWHWSGALPYQDIGVSGGGFNDILFIDEQHGWVAYHNYVLITKDGGSHWSYTLVR